MGKIQTNACNSINWLVVSTHLKTISQNGNLPQIGVKIKNLQKHHPDYHSESHLQVNMTVNCSTHVMCHVFHVFHVKHRLLSAEANSDLEDVWPNLARSGSISTV